MLSQSAALKPQISAILCVIVPQDPPNSTLYFSASKAACLAIPGGGAPASFCRPERPIL